MIKFQHPEALYLLFGLIPLVGIFLWFMWGRKKALNAFGENSLVKRLTPGRPTFKHQLKFILVGLSYVALVLALANPQLGRSFEKVQQSGIDLMVALDVSNSMLSEDETPNRLARAKLFVQNLIDDMAGHRVGLVVFAGNAFLQVPITSDYTIARTLLKHVTPEMVQLQGTAIGEAVQIAEKAFGDGSEKNKHKAILVISDGENHEEEALQAIEQVAENGITIHTMGIGSTKGSTIPVYRRGQQVDYKRDQEGNIVFTKLNENMLQQLASVGNGQYFKLNQGIREVSQVLNVLENMEKQEFEERVFADYEDQFQWMLALAILLLTIEYFISEKRNIRFSDWSIFKT